jgi:N-acetylglucosamine kinase-like BadF-type ATPase
MALMPQYFLGVDGGQSSTTAIIGDESGRVLGVGRGGPSNHAGAAEGQAKFVDAIRASVGTACRQAGLEAWVRFFSSCLGFSGGGSVDKQLLLDQILTSEHLLLTDDATIALSGALAGDPGIVVIAGTGSIAFGRNAQGRTARAGGWGYLFGDEGGAFWIAREALRAGLRWEEGWGSPTALRAILLDATRARNMNDLMHRCYTPEFPRPRIASLALQVNYAAEAGDPVARQILRAAAQELAALARAIRSQLFDVSEPVPCAYVGGVFHSRGLRRDFQEAAEREPGLLATDPVHDPAVGALLEAYRVVGTIPYGIRQPFVVRRLG